MHIAHKLLSLHVKKIPIYNYINPIIQLNNLNLLIVVFSQENSKIIK